MKNDANYMTCKFCVGLSYVYLSFDQETIRLNFMTACG